MSARLNLLSLLILVTSVSSLLLYPETYSLHNSKIILPQKVTGTVDRRSTNQSPIVSVTSVFNETRGSWNHAFACYDRPDFFSTEKKKWTTGTKQTFELDCWTRPISQTQGIINMKGVMTCFDNEMSWFRSSKEGCWFPDYVVQKNAAYGPATGGGGPPWMWAAQAAAKGGQSTVKGPPWAQWAQGSPGPKSDEDLRNQLRYCPPPIHQIGNFREQYKGQTYCYRCTRLDCTNKQIRQVSAANPIQLDCWILGDGVEADQTWWKVKSEDCFIPNQVFDPSAFQGNAAECAKK